MMSYLHLNSTTSSVPVDRTAWVVEHAEFANSPQQLESAQPEKSIPIKNVDNTS
jgi:hypothetical protein